jgi:hypothetical protein
MRSLRRIAFAAACLAFSFTHAADSAAQEKPAPGKPWIITGTLFFLGSYIPMLGYGGLASLVCGALDSEGSGSCDPPNPGFMLIPIAGPFMFAGQANTDMSGTERALLITDGFVQLAGASLILVGVLENASAKPRVVPRENSDHDHAARPFRVLPMIQANAMGVSLSGSF